MRENKVEQRLTKKVRSAGGLALKFVSPQMAGVPDRIILVPGGLAVFVECKAPGEKLRKLQLLRKQQFEDLGFKVFVADSYEAVDRIIQEVMGREIHTTRVPAVRNQKDHRE